MNCVLVTGAAGYIGSILTEMLLVKGYRVLAVDNFLYQQWSLGHLAHFSNLEIYRLDVRNQDKLRPLLQQADIIIPLAGIVGAPACNKDPTAASTTNVDAQLKLFSLVSSSQAVLMPTTNSGYGTSAPHTVCDENTPLHPLSDYAKQKVIVEEHLLKLPNAISLRLATVFGSSPRMRLDLLVNDLCHRAITERSIVLFEAHFRRNYIHVRDVARTFLHAITNLSTMKGQVYNVGLSEANLTKAELCAVIHQYVKELAIFEAPLLKDPDQRDYLVSNAKLEATGWRPEWSLERGIKELISAYKMLPPSRLGNV